LNEKRLQAVETAFSVLDEDKTEMLFLDDIKMKFNAKKHPEVFKKRKNQEEILLEFLDCFDLNYAYLVKNKKVFNFCTNLFLFKISLNLNL
jgi:sulfur relay (sulfurtransferase) DsrF/TusC family protein